MLFEAQVSSDTEQFMDLPGVAMGIVVTVFCVKITEEVKLIRHFSSQTTK